MIPIKLYKGERIVAVVPELGGKNTQDIVWVHIEQADGGMRCWSLLPEEMPSCMYSIHRAAAEMHEALVAMLRTERVNDGPY